MMTKIMFVLLHLWTVYAKLEELLLFGDSSAEQKIDTSIESFRTITTDSYSSLEDGIWTVLDYNASISARHEACFVMVGTKAYLIGGRKKVPVNIYDTTTGRWTSNGKTPPILLHHMQCVVYDYKIWIVNAWTGNYPKERTTNYTYVYDPIRNQWSKKSALPEYRRRGSSTAVVVDHKIYVSHGNIGGHETKNHSIALAWLDYYNTDTDTWVTNLPNGLYPRDHAGGSLIIDKTTGTKRICITGGRDGGTIGWPSVPQTECFNLVTNRWEIKASIPQPRGGSAYGSSCNNHLLLIAGGEGNGIAYKTFQAFDGINWVTLPNLTIGRHSTGLAIDCNGNSKNAIYIASGAITPGGHNETRSVEKFMW